MHGTLTLSVVVVVLLGALLVTEAWTRVHAPSDTG